MIPATSGTIAIDGYDINTNADIYQKSVGLCLQSNAEIPYLTVLAHLIYFAMVIVVFFLNICVLIVMIVLVTRFYNGSSKRRFTAVFRDVEFKW